MSSRTVCTYIPCRTSLQSFGRNLHAYLQVELSSLARKYVFLQDSCTKQEKWPHSCKKMQDILQELCIIIPLASVVLQGMATLHMTSSCKLLHPSLQGNTLQGMKLVPCKPAIYSLHSTIYIIYYHNLLFFHNIIS